MKANYEEDKVIVSATEPTGVNRKKVWFKKGKNLFNKNNVISNVNLVANGSIESDTSSSIHYIKVAGGQIYTISSNSDRQWVFNTSAEKLSSSTQGSQRTVTSGTSVQINVPSGHKYINIRHYPSNGEDNINQDIQAEQNPAATTYEEYVEPEIYILNSNDVYEKFEKDENKERILFESSDGISGDITLTDNITNYSYLEIYYKQNDGTYGYTKCVARNNAHIDLTVNHITNNGYANSFSSRTINLYNNTITTLNTNRYISGNITSDNNLSGTTATNNIYITKIVGYK